MKIIKYVLIIGVILSIICVVAYRVRSPSDIPTPLMHEEEEENADSNISKPAVEWFKTFGGYEEDGGLYVQQTDVGGYIIVGYTKSFGNGEHDVYLIKTDPYGNKIWERTFGGQGFDIGYSIQQCRDGGFIIAGLTSSCIGGDEDVYLIRTDADGVQLWYKTLGNSLDNCSGRFVQITPDEGYIITGSSNIPGHESLDFLLLRTDSDGTLLWNKTYNGRGRDLGRCVQNTIDGGFIVTGIGDSLGPEKGVYVFKTDSVGDMVWNASYGGDDSDAGLFLQPTDDGGYVVIGYSESFSGGDDAYLVRIDSDGRELWSKTFGGSGYDKGSCIQKTVNGSFLVSGTTSSYGAGDNDFYLLEIASSGQLIWNVTFGGVDNDGGSCAQVTDDGGFIVTGYTRSFGMDSYDVCLVKFSPRN